MSDDTPLNAAPPRRFDPVEAAVGVITRPVAALREIAAARPWQFALILVALSTLLSSVAGLTAPDASWADDDLGQVVGDNLEAWLAFASSPAGVILWTILSPLVLALTTYGLYLVGRRFGGHGPFTALLATQGFATVPILLQAPLTAVVNLAGPALEPLYALVSLGFWVWSSVLAILGLRESMGLTTGRAVLVTAVLLLVLFLLLLVVLVALIVFAVSTSLAP